MNDSEKVRRGREEKSSASIVFKNTDYSSLYMEEWKKDFERKLEKLENTNFNLLFYSNYICVFSL
jgi:hypothetical protein